MFTDKMLPIRPMIARSLIGFLVLADKMLAPILIWAAIVLALQCELLLEGAAVFYAPGIFAPSLEVIFLAPIACFASSVVLIMLWLHAFVFVANRGHERHREPLMISAKVFVVAVLVAASFITHVHWIVAWFAPEIEPTAVAGQLSVVGITSAAVLKGLCILFTGASIWMIATGAAAAITALLALVSLRLVKRWKGFAASA